MVLGWKASAAEEKLRGEGYDVTMKRYEAPHTTGNEYRVIRETFRDRTATLIVSRFQTEVAVDGENE